jgi:hypothetical protein
VLKDGRTPEWGAGDWYTDYEKHFLSHLPIEMDQSSSWAQHMLLMLNEQGNEELRDRLGLGDGTVYRDIYMEIGQQLVIPVEDSIKRKLVKAIAIGWGYGASDENCQRALITFRNEKVSEESWVGQQTDAVINALATQILGLLDEEIPVRNQFNDRVKEACNAVRDAGGRDYLQWTTPFGFVVHQRIHEPVKPQPSVRIWTGHYGGKPKEQVWVNVTEPDDVIAWPHRVRTATATSPKSRPDGQKTRLTKTMRQSLPPALIHSYDAGLLHGTLTLGRFSFHRKDDGELVVAGHPYHDDKDVPLDYDEPLNAPHYPIITVQDAFACHANYVEDLRDDLRFNLAHTYAMFDPYARFFRDLGQADSRPTQQHDVDWVRLALPFS